MAWNLILAGRVGVLKDALDSSHTFIMPAKGQKGKLDYSSPNPYNQAMLIITKIQTKELKSMGRADTREYEDLAIPAMDFSSKKELVQEVIDAYDLGELTTLSHVSSPNFLKATVEKDNVAYHLSAKIHEE